MQYYSLRENKMEMRGMILKPLFLLWNIYLKIALKYWLSLTNQRLPFWATNVYIEKKKRSLYLLFISYKFVKGVLAITFLLLVISSWNLHDVCQRILY